MDKFSWKNLPKPVVALAPMSGVSDIAMRSIARSWGSDITFSEFISTDAIHFKVGRYLGIAHPKDMELETADILKCAKDDCQWKDDKSMDLAQFIPEERPFIIQVFGSEPNHFKTAVTVLKERFSPDGFDINFGCPARSVINNGAGSCLFMEPEKAKRIIEVTKEAAGDLPVSIKLRAAFKDITALEFLKSIEGAPFENVTLHMRSYDQVHHGQPNWDSAKILKEYLEPKGIPLIANGGITSGKDAKDVLDYTKADGVMVAQASIGNPFIFKEIKQTLKNEPYTQPTLAEKLATIIRHAQIMVSSKGDQRGIIEMRKHLLWYLKGWPDASELRKQCSQVTSYQELETILANLSTPTPQLIHT